jgi:hypothetical protein
MKTKKTTTKDLEKIVSAMLYILKCLGVADHHSIFKVMYFADRKRLGLHGTPIFNETYIKMKWGPVPSWSRDILKSGRIGRLGFKFKGQPIGDLFEFLDATTVRAKADPDMNYLAPIDITLLDEAISEIRALGVGEKGFVERTTTSHDSAWETAAMNKPISRREMIKATGNEGVLQVYDEREELKGILRQE